MSAPTACSRRWLLTGGAATAPRGRGIVIADGCLARLGIVCQSCGDVCPEGAIRFALRRGGPPLPAVEKERCTGCGACLEICPVNAIALLTPEATHGNA
jgi:ferredoxin-type protein NapF